MFIKGQLMDILKCISASLFIKIQKTMTCLNHLYSFSEFKNINEYKNKLEG